MLPPFCQSWLPMLCFWGDGWGKGGHLRDHRGNLVANRRLGLLALAAIVMIGSAAARAEDLDQGKSAPRLFADSCVACHHTARGLAKGRFSLTLFMFLRDHYATNSSAAWSLTSYLESVDAPAAGRPRTTAAKPATSSAATSLRPPMPVPVR